MGIQVILKMVADRNRLRIINIIKDNALCVGEIQTLLGTTQSNTSRHLEKLKSSGLTDYYKDAQRIFYFIKKDVFIKYRFFNDLVYIDTLKDNQFIQDAERLEKYKASGLNCEDLRSIGFDYNKIIF